ncbi:uncharacterized protein LOC129905931 [Episyrphus balteatus]|uniref:uncharacterized protein LOC129905931 n=1 Tax=Episyrphus balteatus TaxID=286459 RepID=UPI002485B9C8|nr:uncharacterized protein LOC129905931 [Episyrphus balteatus]
MTTCYKRLSFSNDEEYKLIEFIKKHPALWDASHSEYGNSDIRKLYWQMLAKQLNKTVFEVRRKWRFVRDYYIHKRRRHPDSTPQRDGKYYSLQFLNKIKVCSKKFPLNSDSMNQIKLKTNKINVTKNVDKIEVDYVDSDEEIDYDFLDDPTFEKITVERLGNEQKYATTTPSNITDGDDNSQQHDAEINDDKSDDFVFKEDYIDESSVAEPEDFARTIEEIDAEEAQIEHNVIETNNDNENTTTFEQTSKQTDRDSASATMLHEKAIDLFFESMAAAVKTFPPQYVAEAKCKVFMAFNEVESKVYQNANKN